MLFISIEASEDGKPLYMGGRRSCEQGTGRNPLMYFGRRLSSGHVLNGLDRTPHTITFILHEEDVNQFPMMTFFGWMFSEVEVSV